MSFDLRLTISGSPLAADPNPNTTAPTLDRVFTTPTKAGSVSNGPVQVLGMLKDGTSCNFTVWMWSAEFGVWCKIGDTTNVLAKQLGTVGNVPCNADVFVQLTNIIGAPTMFGVAVGYGSKSQDAPSESTSWKQPVRLATLVALPACALVGNTLTGNVNGVIPPATTDGFAVAITNDILVAHQGGVAAHLQDGIFRVVDEGLAGGGGRPWVLTRTPHCDESDEVFDGMMVVVGEGNTLKGHVFEQVTDTPITINVTALEFRDLGTLWQRIGRLLVPSTAGDGVSLTCTGGAGDSCIIVEPPTVANTWQQFRCVGYEFANVGHARKNFVCRIGHNAHANQGIGDPDYPSMIDSWEQFYSPVAGQEYAERHISFYGRAAAAPFAQTEWRCLSFRCDGPTNQIMGIMRFDAMNFYDRLTNISTMGFNAAVGTIVLTAAGGGVHADTNNMDVVCGLKADGATRTYLLRTNAADETEISRNSEKTRIRGDFVVGAASSGAGPRVVFSIDPAKSYFRAGYAVGANWDDGNCGAYSAAFGESWAPGADALASGVQCQGSGLGSVASGTSTKSPGANSHANGNYANSRLAGSRAFSAGHFTDYGDAQGLDVSVSGTSVDAAPVELTLTGAAPGAGERVTIPAGWFSNCSFLVEAIVTDGTDVGKAAAWQCKAAVKNLAGTTSLVGAPINATATGYAAGTWTPVFCDAALATAAIAISRDDANDCWTITGTGVVGIAANTIHWHARITSGEVA